VIALKLEFLAQDIASVQIFVKMERKTITIKKFNNKTKKNINRQSKSNTCIKHLKKKEVKVII